MFRNSDVWRFRVSINMSVNVRHTTIALLPNIQKVCPTRRTRVLLSRYLSAFTISNPSLSQMMVLNFLLQVNITGIQVAQAPSQNPNVGQKRLSLWKSYIVL
jgi:hypothetical protein